jgi:hypothetical protein
MKKTHVSIFVVLLLALLLLTATTAFAQADRTALSGTEDNFIAGAHARVWEADGWVQQRDVPFTGTFDFGAMKGTETQLDNAKLNPATGEGHIWGTVTYTDSATGITCSGIRQGQLTNFLLTAEIVARCSDGSLLRGTVQDVELIFPPGSPAPSEVISHFDGALLNP